MCTASRSAPFVRSAIRRRPPDQRVALGAAGERDDDPLAGLPGAGDVVVGPVPVELVVDLVGQPEQASSRSAVRLPIAEVVGQRRVDLLRRVDVPVRHPPAQRLRGHVDQFDLVGAADDLVGHGLPLRHPGDLLDDVVERFQVLDVHGRDDVDAGVEQPLDVLPAFVVARAGHVRVRELVDQRHRRRAGDHGVGVHLGEGRAPVGHLLAGHDLQAVEQLGRARPPVGLHVADHHVGTPLVAAAAPPPASRRSCPRRGRPPGRRAAAPYSSFPPFTRVLFGRTRLLAHSAAGLVPRPTTPSLVSSLLLAGIFCRARCSASAH